MVHRSLEETVEHKGIVHARKYKPLLYNLSKLQLNESLEVSFSELRDLGLMRPEVSNNLRAWIYAKTKGKQKDTAIYGWDFKVIQHENYYFITRIEKEQRLRKRPKTKFTWRFVTRRLENLLVGEAHIFNKETFARRNIVINSESMDNFHGTHQEVRGESPTR